MQTAAFLFITVAVYAPLYPLFWSFAAITVVWGIGLGTDLLALSRSRRRGS
ncbi:MAG: hypothetical protein KF819_25215 [Labilithrix sp.]|nr:hypothetical protein [Labilithrix sp.]